MKKEKEKIRTQIIKALEVYRGKKGFEFFDSSTPSFESDLITLDGNELEVLLVTIEKSNKILLTTKCTYLIRKSKCYRIEGDEIEKFDSITFQNCRPEKTNSMLKRIFKKRQMVRIVGDFKLIKKGWVI